VYNLFVFSPIRMCQNAPIAKSKFRNSDLHSRLRKPFSLQSSNSHHSETEVLLQEILQDGMSRDVGYTLQLSADVLYSIVLVWNALNTDAYTRLLSIQPLLPCSPWISSGARMECYCVTSQNNEQIISTIPDKHSNGVRKQEGIVDAAKHSLIVRTICKQNTK